MSKIQQYVTNNCLETMLYNSIEMLGILDLRLAGYYKIKHNVLQKKSG